MEQEYSQISSPTKLVLVLMHIFGFGLVAAAQWDAAPAEYSDGTEVSFVMGRLVATFVMVCIIFLIGRRLFRSFNQNIAQPLILLIAYGIVLWRVSLSI